MSKFLHFFKIIVGSILKLIPLILAIIIFFISIKSNRLDSDILYLELFFGKGYNGGASMTPIFYGLMIISGTLLINSINKEKINSDRFDISH